MTLLFRALLGLIILMSAPLASAASGAEIVKIENYASSFVQPRNISILLPPGYHQSKQRYPVIYMHDGQNLFEPGYAYGGKEWGIDEAMAGRKSQAIVVGIWNTNLRGREYLPAKVVANLPADVRQRIQGLHGGPSLADEYVRFLIEELKPYIDRTYRTKTGPRDTSLMGSSMGGLISLYAMGEYPHIFGNAAALSIHWPLADPTKASEADRDAIVGAFKSWMVQSRVRPGKNRFYTDHGTINLDSFYEPYSSRMDKVFAEKGWVRGKNWSSRIFPGTDHNEAAWRERVSIPLDFLLTPAK